MTILLSWVTHLKLLFLLYLKYDKVSFSFFVGMSKWEKITVGSSRAFICCKYSLWCMSAQKDDKYGTFKIIEILKSKIYIHMIHLSPWRRTKDTYTCLLEDTLIACSCWSLLGYPFKSVHIDFIFFPSFFRVSLESLTFQVVIQRGYRMDSPQNSSFYS